MPVGKKRAQRPWSATLTSFASEYVAELTRELYDLDFIALEKIAAVIDKARQQDKTVFVMGNGGSASSSSHIATDLCKTASAPGGKRIKAISLTDNVAFMTAISNDIAYENVFSRQLESYMGKGDVILLVSASGNSPNVVEAARYGKKRGATVISLVGFDGGKLKKMSDIFIHIKSWQYGVVEDAHMSIGHILTFFFKAWNQGKSKR